MAGLFRCPSFGSPKSDRQIHVGDESKKPPSLAVPNSPTIKVADDTKYYDQSTGVIKWPINDGFEGIVKEVTLRPGTRIDRYGFESGTFVSPEGIPYEMRSLAPGTNNKPYHVYEVLKPIDGLEGKIAPWFDEVGGGVQYKLTKSIQELIDEGYLREVFD